MRIKRLRVTGQFFAAFLRNGQGNVFTVIEDGLPDDAKFLYAGADPIHAQNIFLVIQSDTFDDIADGDVIPELPAPKMQLVRAVDSE